MAATRVLFRQLPILVPCICLLVGCGGGGGGGGTGFSVRGQVQLPAGFALPASTLTAQTGFGTVPLASGGQFNVEAGQASPSLVQIVNAAGKAVTVAFADPSSSAPTQIGPRQMADALLYFQLGGFMLPPDHTRPMLQVIDADPNVGALTATITARMVANPTALADDDPQIIAAVGLAATTIVRTRAQSRVRSTVGIGAAATGSQTSRARVVSIAVRAATRGNGPLLLIAPDPTQLQSGVQVQQNPVGSGIIVTNNFRRESEFYVYQTGYVPTADPTNPVMYGTAKDTNGGRPYKLDATSKLGVINLLKDVFTGGAPWSPVNSAPIDLPQVTNSIKTFYEVVVINPSFGQTTAPAVFSDPRYAPYVGQWQISVTDQTLLTFIKDIIIPFIGAITGGFEGVYDVQKYVPNTAIWLQKWLPGTTKEVTDGEWEAALEDVINVIKSSDLARGEAVDVFKDIMRKQSEAVAQLQKFAQYIGAYKLIDSFLKLADVASVVSALRAPNNPAEVWGVTVFQPNVHLEPSTATVSSTSSIVVLAATIPGTTDLSQFRFAWSTTGTEGHLEKLTNSVPLPTSPIADSSADYVADLLKLTPTGSDTVTVKVFKATDLTTPIGQATSTISAAQTGTCGEPPPPVLDTAGAAGLLTTTLDKANYKAGDTMTVTLSVAGGHVPDSRWEVSVWGGPKFGPFANVTTVDGKPTNFGGNSSMTFPLNGSGAAETHVVTFTMSAPLDKNGQPVVACSAPPVNGNPQGPFVFVTAGPHSTYNFYNASP